MMAEPKNIRRKDTKEVNFEKLKLKETRKQREIQRRKARRNRHESNT